MYSCAPGAPLPSAAILIFSSSASCSRFAFARRFWNQIFTCVSVSRNDEENSARSAMLRYCFSRNFFSSDNSCCVVNGVRGFRFGLCFLRLHLIRGGSLLSGSTKKRENKISLELIENGLYFVSYLLLICLYRNLCLFYIVINTSNIADGKIFRRFFYT